MSSRKKQKSMDENPVDDSQIAFDLQILNSSHSDIKKLKRQHPTSIHGNKFWGSSFLIIDYFRRNPPQEKLKVLELGCGWALAGIYLNKNFSSKVDCLDADEDVFPYAQLHADINQASIHTQQKRFEKITKSELGEYDLIIAADVCFWDELSDIHFNLIRRALQAGVKKIVYADPERAPFTLLAQRCEEKLQSEGIRIQCIDARVKSLKASGKLLIIEQQ